RGGGIGVRDENLLDSALAHPQQARAYGGPPPDLADLAASLAFGLSRNHPFVDGNKRTTHVCYRVFLALNGADLVASNEDKYVIMIALAGGEQPVRNRVRRLVAPIHQTRRQKARERAACALRALKALDSQTSRTRRHEERASCALFNPAGYRWCAATPRPVLTSR
ncbi:MAG TPA: type II toxin-antitoxin system death-on-curing family toxin, partial [Gallionella sp.]|nr:type II toxin-antitoxin system death-on-curing family toxin [Gallionella sp.]